MDATLTASGLMRQACMLGADNEMRRLLTELFQSLRLRELQPTVWMSRPGAALSRVGDCVTHGD